jgi:GNAT superfamily N-acetyltransferase
MTDATQLTAPIEIVAASAEHAAALVALFDACGSPCYCRYWHFNGDNNAWLDRCANAPAKNRAELEAAIAAGSGEARGVVARLGEGGTLVGWMKVAPAAVMRKAFERKPYRGLPCFARDPRDVFVIGCALVHPAHRRRGIASALVEGATRLAPTWGARTLEAFPRKLEALGADEDAWTGPFGAFVRNGFVEVDGVGPYPVMRRSVG